jgi:hypothetical protein
VQLCPHGNGTKALSWVVGYTFHIIKKFLNST